MRHHRSLLIWQKTKALVSPVYEMSARLPRSERFVHVDQVRRCVVSIASNIAEGAASDTDAQFRRFLGYAMGSAAELQSQLEICVELGFLESAEQGPIDAQLEELKRMISGFRRRLK